MGNVVEVWRVEPASRLQGQPDNARGYTQRESVEVARVPVRPRTKKPPGESILRRYLLFVWR